MLAHSTYDIAAVKYGALATMRSDVFLNYADYRESDEPTGLSYYFWVVRNGDRVVLVDTGFDPAVGARRGRTTLIDPFDAWTALGVPDEEDTTVVLTHAHYDHIGNVRRLKRARFVMAAAEYDFWISRPRQQRITRQVIEEDELAVLAELRASGRLTLIEDSQELVPGIDLLLAPGHTPGQLMLHVQTAEGGVLLAADAIHVDEELDRRMPFRHMCDIVAAADSYEIVDHLRTSGAVTHVIAGHEPSLMERFPTHPALPEHTIVLGSSAA
ncbi:glyoxylase-like metal-dependent hydrolase (beta-lactamase superfamily II) [Microbacterium ginsengiterrae]|uniref:Glyoxylase-like metal-dependent hydrolase (Beta-lactamase superfamily II) n=1 Tax=Microbacterium ginsengiterrae TaxID=546115 RepID=A0A7W9FD53_9MICO|nr:glyoxylase-like metal-dependent hydrolase (beta-lactamase superfamily II) [Microbacterium ginsengiterrae]